MFRAILIVLLIQTTSLANTIVLCGGGDIPEKVIDFIKSQKSTNRCLVLSPHDDFNKRWDKYFSNVVYLTLPDFSESSDLDFDILVCEGGNQFQYIQNLNKDKFHELYKKKITIIATSAGAMILGSHVFTAEHGSITSEEAKTDNDKVCITQFLAIPELADTIIDTHYSERNRRERLKIFMKKGKIKRGIGLDEATSLCIDDSGFHVFGLGNIEIVLGE